jgi:hypothetical protein
MNLQDENYDPNGFIDWLREVYKVKSDALLAIRIGISPVAISRIRHRYYGVGAAILIDIHEYTGMRTLDIKARMFKPSADADASYVRQAA